MSDKILIRGVTKAGRPFRPSDWCERLTGVLSIFGEDNRTAYSSGARPMTVAGVKCVEVDRCLETANPRAFAFVMGFAKDNDLEVIDEPDAP